MGMPATGVEFGRSYTNEEIGHFLLLSLSCFLDLFCVDITIRKKYVSIEALNIVFLY